MIYDSVVNTTYKNSEKKSLDRGIFGGTIKKQNSGVET